jgi:hypothetical protein
MNIVLIIISTLLGRVLMLIHGYMPLDFLVRLIKRMKDCIIGFQR